MLKDTMTVELDPPVSIAMPVFNCERTLATAIRSILNQTFEDFTLLLLDDGSTDRSLEIAQSFVDSRVRIFADGMHRGIASRLNQAISLSRGKYFARMDSDDVSYPDRLALQMEFLSQHPEIDLLGGGVLVFGPDGEALGTRRCVISHKQICERPWRGFLLAHPTWMGKTEWFRSHLYHDDVLRGEDQDLLFRSHESSRFAALPEIIVGYREGHLSLKNLLRGRTYFVKCVVRDATEKGKYFIAGAAILEQALKGLVDCFAIYTGLNYKILRHRALPIGEEEKQRWAQVWNATQQKIALIGRSNGLKCRS